MSGQYMRKLMECCGICEDELPQNNCCDQEDCCAPGEFEMEIPLPGGGELELSIEPGNCCVACGQDDCCCDPSLNDINVEDTNDETDEFVNVIDHDEHRMMVPHPDQDKALIDGLDEGSAFDDKCPGCKGEGVIGPENEFCPDCSGTGELDEFQNNHFRRHAIGVSEDFEDADMDVEVQLSPDEEDMLGISEGVKDYDYGHRKYKTRKYGNHVYDHHAVGGDNDKPDVYRSARFGSNAIADPLCQNNHKS
jgi:hypothetical protein